jgi:hypothetical protein
MIREKDSIVISINPQDGTVTVQAADCDQISVEGEASGWSYDNQETENTRRTRDALANQLKNQLEKEAGRQEQELQSELTNKLEAQLHDLRKELDQVANQVTGAALKRKAAQLGQIKEISEDAATGSMTIVLEV